jgi:DNA-binding HxlR family transcriptional regulator
MNKDINKKNEKRSDCPISCTMELIGDKWSLLIIRDILFFGKCTYNDFLDSPESISTNILHDRLIMLSEKGLIGYTGVAKRKKYFLTETGMDLKPVLESIGIFGMKHFKESKEYVKTKMQDRKK